jgi:hypothetical protein
VTKSKIAVFILSFLILTKFNIDPDFGWHLAIGNKFLNAAHIVRGDEFSWTMKGYYFGNYFFLYQILIAFIYKNFGYIVLSLIFGAIAALAVLAVCAPKLDFGKILTVLLGAAVASFSLAVRPINISFLLFALVLVFLERRYFEKLRHVFIWLTLFGLWANFHQGFLVGLGIFGIFLAVEGLASFARSGKASLKLLYPRALCFIAAFFGTFLTFYGLQVWKSIFADLTGAQTWLSISEWQPAPLIFPLNLLYGISGIVFIYILTRTKKDFNAPLFLVGAFVFALPFLMANTIVFWAILFIYISSRYFSANLNFRFDNFAKLPIFFSFLAAVLVLFLNFALGVLQTVDLKSRLTLDGYPVGALNFMEQKGLGERLFNDYSWGGFLIWQYSQKPVFIDGRMTGWRNQEAGYILSDYVDIERGRCELLKKFDAQTVLVKKSAKVPCFANWQKVYEDDVAKVLVK